MPITGLQLITVTATYLKLDGTPATGTVTFTPSTVIVNTAADEIVYPYPFTATLDGTGSFSIVLPATNDPDLTPVGWTYKVKENIVGSTVSREFDIEIPFNAAGATIDMADVAPVSVVGAVTPYVTLTGSQLITGTKTFQPSASNATAIIVRGVGGQSADLQQWQFSNGTVAARVGSAGAIETPYILALGNTGTYIQTEPAGALNIFGRIANAATLIVRATASQTADIQQWQDSAGTRLMSVGPTGNLGINSVITSTTEVGVKDARLILQNNSFTVGGGGEVVLGAISDTPAGRYAVIGSHIVGNSTGGAYGHIYLATKATGADTVLSKRVVIREDGNVGIGDVTPAALLSIGGGSIGDGNIKVQISTLGAGTYSYYGANKNGGYGVVFGFENAAGPRTGGIVRVVTADDLFLETNNGATQLALRGATGTLDMNAVKLKWSDAGNVQTTVGGAGGASALPATPTKYLRVVDNAGTTLVIPAYAA